MSWKGWEDFQVPAPDPGPAPAVPRRKNKYAAERVELAGEWFDSKREARRWQWLQLRAIAGEISGLIRQPSWPFVVNGVHVGSFTADFAYLDVATHAIVVEDAKSAATKRARDYPLRKKLMQACHGIAIVEV